MLKTLKRNPMRPGYIGWKQAKRKRAVVAARTAAQQFLLCSGLSAWAILIALGAAELLNVPL